MAEEHVGPRPAAWTKIFSGFRVALDLKKLLLAGAGILATALGWWVLSWVAFSLVSKPDWNKQYAGHNKPEEWSDFKARRASWNLLYLLAGVRDPYYDAADLATTLPEFEALQGIKHDHDRFNKESVKVRAIGQDKELTVEVGEKQYPIEIVADPKGVLGDVEDKEHIYPFREFKYERENLFLLGHGAEVVTIKVLQNADKVRDYRDKAADLTALQMRALTLEGDKRTTFEAALKAYRDKMLANDMGVVPVKQGDLIGTLPWFAYRGENPFLLVSRIIKETAATQAGQTTAPRGHFLAAFAELIPVLLEPLVKILTPVVYLFHPAADWYVKIYLLLVLLYALAVWGFFGGAITRLAAVQIARNEKIPLREAIVFAKDRFVSFFAAPAFPLLLLGILVVALWLFGWVEGFIPMFGDIVVAGVLWPIVLVVGLIMAVVLVGLVGWPLMNATISVEGSDSFDALSRSYSYVYQAPWQYLWYGLVATAYGAALVFFVGFMASLIVFLGKWGVGMTPGIGSSELKNDREPSYLFMYAPTSFGWRDLLIHDSPNVQPVLERAPTGPEYRFKDRYAESLTWYNKFGAALVSVWIYAFFLLVVGFGYSYFWTAATTIYFLMRRHVDDTDLDEVHLEEDDALDPFARPPAAPAAPPPPKTDKVSLSMVDAPVLRPANPPPAPPPMPPPPPVAPELPLESPAAPPIAPLAPAEPAAPPIAPLAPAEPPPTPMPSASDTYVPPPTEPPGPPPTTP